MVLSLGVVFYGEFFGVVVVCFFCFLLFFWFFVVHVCFVFFWIFCFVYWFGWGCGFLLVFDWCVFVLLLFVGGFLVVGFCGVGVDAFFLGVCLLILGLFFSFGSEFGFVSFWVLLVLVWVFRFFRCVSFCFGVAGWSGCMVVLCVFLLLGCGVLAGCGFYWVCGLERWVWWFFCLFFAFFWLYWVCVLLVCLFCAVC